MLFSSVSALSALGTRSISLIAVSMREAMSFFISIWTSFQSSAVQMPFRQPRYLTLGNDERPAQLYLREDGVPGFIALSARELGVWGNEIAVSVRPAGPAMYDVCIVYQGQPYENARQVVRGDPLPALTQDALQANAIGILQAKAAGVHTTATRDRAGG